MRSRLVLLGVEFVARGSPAEGRQGFESARDGAVGWRPGAVLCAVSGRRRYSFHKLRTEYWLATRSAPKFPQYPQGPVYARGVRVHPGTSLAGWGAGTEASRPIGWPGEKGCVGSH
jgi:hypothetical protein